MSIGSKEQKKLKSETLGYSYPNHEQYIAYGDPGQEVAFTLGNGVNEATVIWTAEEAGSKCGITMTTGKTNIKLVTRAGDIKVIAVTNLSSAATSIIAADRLMIKLDRGGVMKLVPLPEDFESVDAFPKEITCIPVTGFVPDPILGISIDTDASKVVGYFDLYY